MANVKEKLKRKKTDLIVNIIWQKNEKHFENGYLKVK